MTLTDKARQAILTILPDALFREEFQRAIQLCLPDLGEGGMMPKLQIMNLRPETGDFDFDFCILADADYNEHRREMLRLIGQQQARDGRQSVMACLASEAWMMLRTDPTDRTPASEDPERKEGIIVVAASIDGRVAMASTIVTRGDDDTFSAFGDLDINYSFDENANEFTSNILANFWHGYREGLIEMMDNE